jgi:N-ATPase, AtpR subunit
MITDIGFLAVGLLAGTLHFALLRRNAALFVQPGRIWMAAALQVARLGVLAGLLVMAALHGASPLLLTALGLLIARPIVLRRITAS